MLAGPLTVEKAEQVSKYYFYLGFLCLPWLWAANAFCFWRHRDASPIVAWYVRMSIVAALVGLAVFVSYLTAIHTSLDPSSVLWVIRPRQPAGTVQQGLFSDAVYNNLAT